MHEKTFLRQRHVIGDIYSDQPQRDVFVKETTDELLGDVQAAGYVCTSGFSENWERVLIGWQLTLQVKARHQQ